MKKLALVSAILFLFFFLLIVGGKAASVKDQIRFGIFMAEKGHWREALFRWEKALKYEPENYRLYNNIAVAYEALGEYDKAERAYQIALKYGKNNARVQENYHLFKKFYSNYKSYEKKPNDQDKGEHH